LKVFRYRKPSPAIADECGETVRTAIGHNQINVAVAIDVTRRDRPWRFAYTDHCGRGKLTVTITEENREIIGTAIHNCEVALSIAIEIADRHGHWFSAGCETRLDLELRRGAFVCGPQGNAEENES
jgi:hypothetical protein